MQEKKTNVRFIIQIAGKPAQNVKKALDAVLGKLKSDENSFRVMDSEIIEPELDEESTLYSGFIDILIRFSEFSEIFNFILDYTPNSVEIESPENFNFNSSDFTSVLNDMSNFLLKSQNEVRQLRAHIHLMNSKK